MKTILTIVGARPQFIKAATVSRAFAGKARELLVHTGQHYDENMSDVFFMELGIPRPAYNLEVGSGRHGAQTGKMLDAIERVILDEKPDWVLVYGDTNSTLAGALAAAKLHVPVAHVEAGLRSFNRRMPEEINRVLTDHAAELLFVPTAAALANLEREGLPAERLQLVGDVMYDAALYYGNRADAESTILEVLGLASKSYVLATCHRAENTDDPDRLKTIVDSLLGLDLPVVLPIHPRTRAALAQQGLLDLAGRGLRLIDPLGYLDMVMLEKHACLVATDSGGVQKEAFFYRVPCVTLRDETEWVELVELGWNRLAPPTSRNAVSEVLNQALLAGPGREAHPYGDGHSAEKIVAALLESHVHA